MRAGEQQCAACVGCFERSARGGGSVRTTARDRKLRERKCDLPAVADTARRDGAPGMRDPRACGIHVDRLPSGGRGGTQCDGRAQALNRDSANAGTVETRVANLRDRAPTVVEQRDRRVHEACRRKIARDVRDLRERTAVASLERDVIASGDRAARVQAAEVAVRGQRGDAHVPRRSSEARVRARDSDLAVLRAAKIDVAEQAERTVLPRCEDVAGDRSARRRQRFHRKPRKRRCRTRADREIARVDQRIHCIVRMVDADVCGQDFDFVLGRASIPQHCAADAVAGDCECARKCAARAGALEHAVRIDALERVCRCEHAAAQRHAGKERRGVRHFAARPAHRGDRFERVGLLRQRHAAARPEREAGVLDAEVQHGRGASVERDEAVRVAQRHRAVRDLRRVRENQRERHADRAFDEQREVDRAAQRQTRRSGGEILQARNLAVRVHHQAKSRMREIVDSAVHLDRSARDAGVDVRGGQTRARDLDRAVNVLDGRRDALHAHAAAAQIRRRSNLAVVSRVETIQESRAQAQGSVVERIVDELRQRDVRGGPALVIQSRRLVDGAAPVDRIPHAHVVICHRRGVVRARGGVHVCRGVDVDDRDPPRFRIEARVVDDGERSVDHAHREVHRRRGAARRAAFGHVRQVVRTVGIVHDGDARPIHGDGAQAVTMPASGQQILQMICHVDARQVRERLAMSADASAGDDGVSAAQRHPPNRDARSGCGAKAFCERKPRDGHPEPVDERGNGNDHDPGDDRCPAARASHVDVIPMPRGQKLKK